MLVLGELCFWFFTKSLPWGSHLTGWAQDLPSWRMNLSIEHYCRILLALLLQKLGLLVAFPLTLFSKQLFRSINWFLSESFLLSLLTFGPRLLIIQIANFFLHLIGLFHKKLGFCSNWEIRFGFKFIYTSLRAQNTIIVFLSWLCLCSHGGLYWALPRYWQNIALKWRINLNRWLEDWSKMIFVLPIHWRYIFLKHRVHCFC